MLFCNRICNVVHLPLNACNLPFPGKGDALKLAVSDDDSVVIPGCDTGTELLPVGRLKILLRCDQDICPRIQAQKIAAPLFGQMVRHDI